MQKVLDTVRAWVELGASQEDMASGDYAERVINSWNNCELIEALDDASVWAESLSAEELREKGLA
jgi:hypothetical protein